MGGQILISGRQRRMSFLLDIHAFLWWLTADPRLSQPARSAIENANERRYVSSVTAYEISNKFRIGKLDIAREIIENFELVVAEAGFEKLPVTASHAILAGKKCSPRTRIRSIEFWPRRCGSILCRSSRSIQPSKHSAFNASGSRRRITPPPVPSSPDAVAAAP